MSLRIHPHAFMGFRAERGQRDILAGDRIELVHQPRLRLRDARVRDGGLTLRPHLFTGQECVPRRPHQAIEAIPIEPLGEHSRLPVFRSVTLTMPFVEDLVRVIEVAAGVAARSR